MSRGLAVAAPMLRPRVDALVQIVVAQIPWLARIDELSTAGATLSAGRYQPGYASALLLMLPAIALTGR